LIKDQRVSERFAHFSSLFAHTGSAAGKLLRVARILTFLIFRDLAVNHVGPSARNGKLISRSAEKEKGEYDLRLA
jgi:hypothetical protein